MSDKKTCPIMSGPVADSGARTVVYQQCLGHDCQLYIQAYTTENISVYGCAYELGPQMVDGQVRV